MGVLLAGTVFLLTGIFHTNLWFDESYTVALLSHDIGEMCCIAAKDVHPVLYYLMLKLFTLVFGDGIIVLRLFSVIGAVLFASLGYTHIRRDFGEKTGLYFSLITYLTFATFSFGGEIRMYTWAPLFVTLTAIYAYRLTDEHGMTKRNMLLFVLFSVLCAYTHYYGLIATGFMNIFLFVMFKKRENEKQLKSYLKCGAAQLIAYIPGFVVFVMQTSVVARGFWIKITYPRIIFELLDFLFIGELGEINAVSVVKTAAVCLIFALLISKLVQLRREDREETRAPFWSLMTVCAVVGSGLFISLFITPLIHVRYLVVLYGLVVFAFAYILAHMRLKSVQTAVLGLTLCLLVTSCIPAYSERYAEDNGGLYEYLDDSLEQGDIVVSEEFVIANFLHRYRDTKMYYYNINQWNIEDAYEAFMPAMETVRSLDFLKEYKGRAWLVSSWEDESLLNHIRELGDGVRVVEKETVSLSYRSMTYVFTLIEKG